MWITVLLVCLAVIFSCSAHVTNNDAHTVTETARTNQEVEWDTTGPSVTLSIQDGRSDAAVRPRDELSRHPLFYSNQWQPFLMPIGLNSNGAINNRYRSEGEDRVTNQFMPTFLRRPDSELNLTLSNRFAQLPNGYRYPFPPVQMPLAPINPMFFYPHQPNLFPIGNYHESAINNVQQNSSTPAARSAVPATEAAQLTDVQESIVPPPPFAAIPDVLERFHPINVHRNNDDLLTSRHPAFLPYPVPPNANDNPLHPVIFPFINSHLYDRERGSAAIESISTGQDSTGSEASANSKAVHEQDVNVSNGTPSDSSPTFVPPELLPLPFAGFPFGLLPPPMFPPIIPDETTPTIPMTEPISLPKETVVSDALLPYTPTPGNSPPLDTSSDILLPANTLEPEGKQSPNIQANAVSNNRPSETKIPYEFGFDMNDGKGTDQYRKEVSDASGAVQGSYGYRDMFGVYRFVNYIADKNGFRAFIKSNEPGVASSGSANVVVMAEQTPVQTIAEGEKVSDPEAIIIPDTATDLITEGSESKAA